MVNCPGSLPDIVNELDEVISDVILWDSKHGHAKIGRPFKTNTKLLTEDTRLQLEDLHETVKDRVLRRAKVNAVQATGPIS